MITRALDSVQESRATWTRPELLRQIDLALPDRLGGLDRHQVRDLVERLTDEAIASSDVVQTSGHHLREVPEELRRSDGTSVYESPRANQYATRDHVIAEEALRRATVDRDRHAVAHADVERWLAGREDLLTTDGKLGEQAQIVRGLATSGAAASVLIGPAGAGKSHTCGALAGAWSDLTGGRVIGLAPTQVATEVLRDDGISAAFNTRAWTRAQARLAAGKGSHQDQELALTARDIVLVDEASMASTRQLTAIRRAVDAAGARMVLAGDPAQLSAVSAGGMMSVMARGEADTYSLSEVRRFSAPWERAASLKLRDGDQEVLREYDRHGRILDGGKVEDAREQVVRGYLADRLSGQRSVIVTTTNGEAATLSGSVREHLVKAGIVESDGVLLGRDGNTAGVGDVIACRRIDWKIGVLNRRQYEVLEVAENGGLTVASVTSGAVYTLPPGYVAKDVELGYAGTVHSTQGQTVDTAWSLVDRTASREGTYVGASRGRERNTLVVVTDEPAELGTDAQKRTPMGVLSDVLERESAQKAAVTVAEEADAEAGSVETLGARVEDAVRVACRGRLDDQLDQLVEDGVISEHQRGKLAVDQGSEYLSRVLRSVEQAGHDPREVLAQAASADLAGARSLAQVLSWRITSAVELTDTGHARIPAGLSEQMTGYLADLHERSDTRRNELAQEFAQSPPAWVLAAFGPAPADQEDQAEARDMWLARVGVVAAHREEAGWDSQEAAVGPAPGMQATERRASWHEAWDALGRPQAQAEEGDMSEGRLRNRVAAWKRAQERAPHFADDHLKAASIAVLEGDQAAVLDDPDDERDEQTEQARAVTGPLDAVARERGLWVTSTLPTREASVRSDAELQARGIQVGDEPDRVSVQEYLTQVVHDEDGPVLVQRPIVEAPAAVQVAGVIPTVDEAEAMRARAAWAGTVLADEQSQEESRLSTEDGWTGIDEESTAWQDADGTELAHLADETDHEHLAAGDVPNPLWDEDRRRAETNQVENS